MGLTNKVNAAEKILLVPLDSRPFCSKLVADSARIASTEIILPPHQLLDFFTIAGEVEGLRAWTLENISTFDAAILSTDQLTVGGLMASREKILSDAEIDGLIAFLIELKRKAPSKKIYAFSILPRHLPPASIENYHQRKALIEYSRLLSRQSSDVEALIELDRAIAVENKKLYFDRFKQSEKLNRRLMALTVDGVIDRLLIGGDDSEPFSMQNVLADRLSKGIKCDRISMTHGADELAMTMLAQHILNGRQFKIKVEYNDRLTAYRVMPFMSTAIGSVAVEKIGLLNGRIVDDGADFTLLISVNGSAARTRRARLRWADEIGLRIGRREKIALVDLSRHFDRDETLLPVMLDRNVPLNGLLAYSSFNTASNAIGCALAEAAIVLSSTERGHGEKVLRSNASFLTGRIIEDEFYLKEAIDTVNWTLRRLGRDPAWLDTGFEFEFATFVMRSTLSKKIERYARSKSFLSPAEFATPEGLITLRADRIEASMRYPWFRTFEIELNCSVF